MLYFSRFFKKMSCKKTKRKINRNWVNFDFEAFFASFFCFANLEKILNALQFYMSGSACFSFFAANVQAKNQSKSEMNLILIDFSLIYISRFLVKFPKFFTKFSHLTVPNFSFFAAAWNSKFRAAKNASE